MKIRRQNRGIQSRHCRVPMLCLLFAFAGFNISATAQTDSGPKPFHLPVALDSEGHHDNAALEFRRLALHSEKGLECSHFLWAAAYEYWKAGNMDLAEKMLDNSEDADPEFSLPRSILRSEIAIRAAKYEESEYHLASVVKSGAPADWRNYAARRMAVAGLYMSDAAGAVERLRSAPEPPSAGIDAIERFQRGSDKSPMLGGLLGIIPGLGYFYSGEYANGARSVILNGLFIWGMASTAEHDQWGLFGVVTFAEITWYTGSIYGGIDAAVRYNRERRDECERCIMGNAGFAPDWSRLPLVELKFQF